MRLFGKQAERQSAIFMAWLVIINLWVADGERGDVKFMDLA
jgi:hypothetical protein